MVKESRNIGIVHFNDHGTERAQRVDRQNGCVACGKADQATTSVYTCTNIHRHKKKERSRDSKPVCLRIRMCDDLTSDNKVAVENAAVGKRRCLFDHLQLRFTHRDTPFAHFQCQQFLTKHTQNIGDMNRMQYNTEIALTK